MTGQSESETEIQSEVTEIEDLQSFKKKKNDQQFVCSYGNCKAVFKRLYRLKRHLNQHTGERPFICDIKGCLRSFTCKTYLSKHQKRPHNIDKKDIKEKLFECRKQYVCSECKKSFKTKFQLKIHSYQHSGQKPLECDKCDKRFATQTKLKSHLKTHEGYVCGREGCDYKTFKWSGLRKHVSIDHKMLKCEVCNKSFTNNSNLNLHKETIHLNPNEKIVCSYDNCNKSYSRKSNLMTHIRAEHEKQVFKCSKEGCLMSFLHKKSLTKHLENHSKPKVQKPKRKALCSRKASKASELTAIELDENQTKELMALDLQFRKQLKEIK